MFRCKIIKALTFITFVGHCAEIQHKRKFCVLTSVFPIIIPISIPTIDYLIKFTFFKALDFFLCMKTDENLDWPNGLRVSIANRWSVVRFPDEGEKCFNLSVKRDGC